MKDELYTLNTVARALGITPRRIRSWADRGALNTLQPKRGAERLVDADEMRRLQRAGYRIRWEVLSQPADAAHAAHAADAVSDDLEAVA